MGWWEVTLTCSKCPPVPNIRQVLRHCVYVLGEGCAYDFSFYIHKWLMTQYVAFCNVSVCTWTYQRVSEWVHNLVLNHVWKLMKCLSEWPGSLSVRKEKYYLSRIFWSSRILKMLWHFGSYIRLCMYIFAYEWVQKFMCTFVQCMVVLKAIFKVFINIKPLWLFLNPDIRNWRRHHSPHHKV